VAISKDIDVVARRHLAQSRAAGSEDSIENLAAFCRLQFQSWRMDDPGDILAWAAADRCLENPVLRIGEMFAGIGGIGLGARSGLERAGVRSKIGWQIEVDEYCQSVLRRHNPSAQIYGDINELNARDLAPVSIVLMGFPCTDISVAGKGEGIHGARSGLFFRAWDICMQLRPRPRRIFLENVPAILVRGLGEVLREITDSGYDCEWGCLSAADVGARHRRNRWWAVCYPQQPYLPW